MIFEKMIEIIKRKSSIPMKNESFCEIEKAYDQAIEILEKSRWIPITTRELTENEKEENPEFRFKWTCPLPDDAEDVIVTTIWGNVQICTFCVDADGSYFDEMDEDEVIAWMRMPEAYKEEN